MEVTPSLYEWLASLGVATSGESLESGLIRLAEDESQRLEEGPAIEIVLRRMAADQKKTMSLNSELIDASVTPSGRLYNWSALTQAVQIFGVTVKPEDKSLIVAGDRQMVAEVLGLLHRASNELMPASSSQHSKKTRITENGGLLIDSIDPEKPLFEAESCLEFLILSCCHNFDLVPTQAAGLLAQGFKYLVHLTAKGLRGDFDPVIYWYQNIYTNSTHLADLLGLDKGISLTFVLNALKSGLLSRSVEVVQWTCRLFSKLALDLHDKRLMPEAWAWFVLPQSGLELSFLVTQKHEAARGVAMEFLLHFSADRFVDLFTIYLRNFMQETADYLAFVTDLLGQVRHSKTTLEELHTTGVTGYWCELAFRETEMDCGRSNSAKLFAMSFLMDVWKQFYAKQTEDIIGETLVNCYRRTSREELIVVKLTSVALLFECLEELVRLKNKSAVQLYKSLTFVFLENYACVELRELICYSFKDLLEAHAMIPTKILIDTLVRRLQLAETAYFSFEFDFFMALAVHQATEVESAVLLIDVLGKVYISDVVFARAASVPFTALASRFISREPMARYLEAFCDLAIKTAVAVSKSMPRPGYSSLKTNSKVEAVNVASSRHKRTVLLDMVCWIVQQEAHALNTVIKDKVVRANRNYNQETGSDLNCLMAILLLFGDPLQIIEERSVDSQEEDPQFQTDGREGIENLESMALVPSTHGQDLKRQRDMRKRQEFPWQRVHASMEQAKAKRLEIDRRRDEQAETLLKKEESRRQKTAMALRVRKLALSVTRGGSASTLLAEGQASKFLTPSALTLRLFDQEDKDEVDSVNVVTKRYSRLFKAMFQKYAGTGFARSQTIKTEIAWVAERKDRMADTEFLKCLKDYGVVPKLISKEEVAEIIRLYNQQIANSSELTVVDFPGMKGVMCQLAYLAFSRGLSDMSGLPSAALVKALVLHIRAHCKAKGISTDCIDEGDLGSGDRDIIRKLNRMLQDDPETQLPENYMRIVEKDVVLVYCIPESVGIQESTRIALEVLDEIIFRAVDTHLLEPVVAVTHSYRAKGYVVKRPEVPLPPIHERPPSLLKRRAKENSLGLKSSMTQRILLEVKLNATLKLLVAQATSEDRIHVSAVAEVLEGVLAAASLGLNRAIIRHRSTSKDIKPSQNPSETERTGRTARHIKRDRELKDELSRAREEREARLSIERVRLKEEADEDERRRSLKDSILKKEFEDRLRLAKIWREEKTAKLKQTEAHESKPTTAEKKKRDEARQRIEERLKTSIEEKKQTYLKLKEHGDKKSMPLLDLEAHKRLSKKLIAEERKKREIAEEHKHEIAELLTSEAVQNLMTAYTKQLRLVFANYCKKSEVKLEHGVEVSLSHLYCSDLVKLALELGISPTYASTEQVGKLFRYLTRKNDIVPRMLDFVSFQEALVRIAAAARERLGDGVLSVETIEALLRALGLTAGVKTIEQRLRETLSG